MPHRNILLLLHLLSSFIYSTVTGDDDLSTMLKLASSINPTPSGWDADSDYCSWVNVKCDSSNRVTIINLANSRLSGTLPSDISTLSQLQSLSFQGNSLTGDIPSLAYLTNLQQVYLDNNNFSSIKSGCFEGLSSLQTLSLDQNVDLEPWLFPRELVYSSSLNTLYLSKVNLHGSLPDVFDSVPNLRNLKLSHNNLTGSLPPSFAASGIVNLWLNDQKLGLSGPINALSSMVQLDEVWLHMNRFTGPIPDLSRLSSLFDLQLSDNLLTGIVPPSLINHTHLQNVSLSNNKLQGSFPIFPRKVTTVEIAGANNFCADKGVACDPQVTTLLEIAGGFGFPTILSDSWMGNDACKGWAFLSCDSRGRVVTANFAKQKLSGTISPAFGNLTALKNLYLQVNNLTGSIPYSLTKLNQLENFDISNNNLTGKIPRFSSTLNLNISGNPFLGTEESSGNVTTPGDGLGVGSNGTKTVLPAAVIAGIAFAALVFITVLMCTYRLKKRPRKFGRVESKEDSTAEFCEVPDKTTGTTNYRKFSIKELQQATNSFSDDNILGKGGFGIVYKGVLDKGREIAVKRMVSVAISKKASSEFEAEIAVLSSVRHRNLVAFLGCCVHVNERMLIYEYMPRGSLGQHLFQWHDRGYPLLSWKQRVSIALDVARGVEYLHGLAQESFIHRDLKPSNILLGDDLRAKVADFGLVRSAPKGNYSIETKLAGTFGYLAPEYAASGIVTTKVDVFAFGVILMELITGKKAFDNATTYEESHLLVTWFRRLLINKHNLPKAIDEWLDPNDETMQGIYLVAELAGHCTAREPFQRPDMGHVVNILSPLIEHWRPVTKDEEEEESTGIDLKKTLPQVVQQWQCEEDTSNMFYSCTSQNLPSILSQS